MQGGMTWLHDLLACRVARSGGSVRTVPWTSCTSPRARTPGSLSGTSGSCSQRQGAPRHTVKAGESSTHSKNIAMQPQMDPDMVNPIVGLDWSHQIVCWCQYGV